MQVELSQEEITQIIDTIWAGYNQELPSKVPEDVEKLIEYLTSILK